MLRPVQLFKRSARAAFRRRYGYSAWSRLSAGIVAALAEHRRRSVGPVPYNGPLELQALTAAYFAARRRFRKRWPRFVPVVPSGTSSLVPELPTNERDIF